MSETAKIDGVGVIEMVDDDIQGMTLFPETPEGNVAAIEHFNACAKENGDVTDEELDEFISEGYYETGTYQLFLVHSN